MGPKVDAGVTRDGGDVTMCCRLLRCLDHYCTALVPWTFGVVVKTYLLIPFFRQPRRVGGLYKAQILPQAGWAARNQIFV